MPPAFTVNAAVEANGGVRCHGGGWNGLAKAAGGDGKSHKSTRSREPRTGYKKTGDYQVVQIN